MACFFYCNDCFESIMKTLLKIRWSQDWLLNHNVQWALQSVDMYALKQMLSRQRHCTEIYLVFCCQIIEVQLKCYAAYASNIRFFCGKYRDFPVPEERRYERVLYSEMQCWYHWRHIYMLSAVSLCHQLSAERGGGGRAALWCVCVCVSHFHIHWMKPKIP